MPFSRQILLWASTRAIAVCLLALPQAHGIPSDLKLFASWLPAMGSGELPSGDLWQYPGGFAVLLGALGFARAGAPGLFLANLAADFAILVVLRRTGGATYWAIVPALMGPLVLTRMDTVVTMFAVLAVVSANSGWRVSGLSVGLGASLKLWPAALLVAMPRPGQRSRLIIASCTFAVMATLAWAVYGANPLSGSQTSRGLQVESLAAWPFMAARALGAPIDLVFRNGATEVVGRLPDLIAAFLTPAALALVGTLWLAVRRGHLREDAALNSVIVVGLLMASSRVLSPQFNVWLLGLVALAISRSTVSRSLVLAASGTALSTQLLYPYTYVNYLQGGWAGLALQTLRLGLLVATVGLAVRQARAGMRPADPLPAPQSRVK